jgi:hypothetical protein
MSTRNIWRDERNPLQLYAQRPLLSVC